MQDHISASIRYTVNTGVKPVSLSRTLGGRIEYRNCTFADHMVEIRNGRKEVDDFDFEQHGFVFVRHVTQVAISLIRKRWNVITILKPMLCSSM